MLGDVRDETLGKLPPIGSEGLSLMLARIQNQKLGEICGAPVSTEWELM